MRPSLSTIFKIATFPTPYNLETPNLSYPALFLPYILILCSLLIIFTSMLHVTFAYNIEVITCDFNYNDHFKISALFIHSFNKPLNAYYISDCSRVRKTIYSQGFYNFLGNQLNEDNHRSE